MTRYYELYARHRADDPSPGCRAVHPSKHAILRSFNKWREMVLLSFGYDPLQCPECKTKMTFLELYFKHKRTSLDGLYERTMAKAKAWMKARCRSS